jgi:hypothetical protein
MGAPRVAGAAYGGAAGGTKSRRKVVGRTRQRCGGLCPSRVVVEAGRDSIAIHVFQMLGQFLDDFFFSRDLE